MKIRIDREGQWYYGDAPIVHPGVRSLFWEHLERTPEGGYRIRMGQEVCEVEVEDVPFVVRQVELDRWPPRALLNDGSWEEFDPRSVRMRDGVPYVPVKGGAFEARFSRQASYDLLRAVEPDGTLRVGERRVRIDVPSGPDPEA